MKSQVLNQSSPQTLTSSVLPAGLRNHLLIGLAACGLAVGGNEAEASLKSSSVKIQDGEFKALSLTAPTPTTDPLAGFVPILIQLSPERAASTNLSPAYKESFRFLENRILANPELGRAEGLKSAMRFTYIWHFVAKVDPVAIKDMERANLRFIVDVSSQRLRDAGTNALQRNVDSIFPEQTIALQGLWLNSTDSSSGRKFATPIQAACGPTYQRHELDWWAARTFLDVEVLRLLGPALRGRGVAAGDLLEKNFVENNLKPTSNFREILVDRLQQRQSKIREVYGSSPASLVLSQQVRLPDERYSTSITPARVLKEMDRMIDQIRKGEALPFLGN